MYPVDIDSIRWSVIREIDLIQTKERNSIEVDVFTIYFPSLLFLFTPSMYILYLHVNICTYIIEIMDDTVQEKILIGSLLIIFVPDTVPLYNRILENCTLSLDKSQLMIVIVIVSNSSLVLFSFTLHRLIRELLAKVLLALYLSVVTELCRICTVLLVVTNSQYLLLNKSLSWFNTY